VFPLDIEERLDDRERKLMTRFERMQAIHVATQALAVEVGAAGAAGGDDGADRDEGAGEPADG
jgi:hypothetical protein